jgi:hypothetical protein
MDTERAHIQAQRSRDYRKTEQGHLNVLAAEKRSRDKLRAETIAAYGGKCVCCGETAQEFLGIDHVNNDGADHRRKLSRQNRNGGGRRTYQWLRQHGYPQDAFQLLCHNCNMARSFYGECPHSREDRPYSNIDTDDFEIDLERGYICVIEGIGWGPFLLPEHALAWALKHKPDSMFKLMPLLNPAIV